MITKYLEKKLKLEGSEEYSLNRPIELEYYLIESEIGYKDNLSGEKVYGIGILKKVSKVRYEEKVISDFSCCIKKTRQVIDILAGNLVTPIGLQPVLEDILGT